MVYQRGRVRNSKARNIAMSVIRLVTDYPGLKAAWLDLGEEKRKTVERLAENRVARQLEKP